MNRNSLAGMTKSSMSMGGRSPGYYGSRGRSPSRVLPPDYPEGIKYYSEGLPQRGYPGYAKSKKMNLEKVPSSQTIITIQPCSLPLDDTLSRSLLTISMHHSNNTDTVFLPSNTHADYSSLVFISVHQWLNLTFSSSPSSPL